MTLEIQSRALPGSNHSNSAAVVFAALSKKIEAPKVLSEAGDNLGGSKLTDRISFQVTEKKEPEMYG